MSLLLECRDRIFEALTKQMGRRGNNLDWIEHERGAVADAATAWASAHGIDRTVTPADVERVEGMALGHIDYASKLSFYVAELVVRGDQ